MRVQIIILGRHTDVSFHVVVRTSDTVFDLKTAIAAAHPEYSDVTKQHLFYDGNELQDARKLASVDVGIMRDDAIVLLSYRPRDTLTRASCASHLAAVGPTYWPPELTDALERIEAGFQRGLKVHRVEEGESGTYFLSAVKAASPWNEPSASDSGTSNSDIQDETEYVACFKPRDEEPNAPNNPKRSVGRFGSPSARIGILSGEAYLREVIAFMLDHGGLSGVPPTGLVTGWHSRFADASRAEAAAEQAGQARAGEGGRGEGYAMDSMGTMGKVPRMRSSSTSSQNSNASSSPHLRAHSGEPSVLLADSVGAVTSPMEPPNGKHLLQKVGSLQLFVPDATCSSDYGTSKFPDEEVQKIALLDIRLLNLDRNGENILIKHVFKPVAPGEGGAGGRLARRKMEVQLIPIDHGMVLPSDLGVATCDWIWMEWPQVKKPLSDKLKEYVRALDVEKDIAKLKAAFGNRLRAQCLTTLRITHAVLKFGIEQGWTLYDIGTILSRPAEDMTQKSAIERLVNTATMWATSNSHNSRFRNLSSHALTMSHHEFQERKDPVPPTPIIHTAESTPTLSLSVLDKSAAVARQHSDPLPEEKSGDRLTEHHAPRWHPVLPESALPAKISLAAGCRPMAISACRAASAKHKVRIPTRLLSDLHDLLPLNVAAPAVAAMDEICVALGCIFDGDHFAHGDTPVEGELLMMSDLVPVRASSPDDELEKSPELHGLVGRTLPKKRRMPWQTYFGLPDKHIAVTSVTVSATWQNHVICVTAVPQQQMHPLVEEWAILHALTTTIVTATCLVAAAKSPAGGDSPALLAAQRLLEAIPPEPLSAPPAVTRASTLPLHVTESTALHPNAGFLVPSPYTRRGVSMFNEMDDAPSADIKLPPTSKLRKHMTDFSGRDEFNDFALAFAVGGPDAIMDGVSAIASSAGTSLHLEASQVAELARFADIYGTHVGAQSLRKVTSLVATTSFSDEWSKLSRKPLRRFLATCKRGGGATFKVPKDIPLSLGVIRINTSQFLDSAPRSLDSPVFGLHDPATPKSQNASPPSILTLKEEKATAFIPPVGAGLKRVGKLDTPASDGLNPASTIPKLSAGPDDLRKAMLRKAVNVADDLAAPPQMPMLRVSSYSAAMSRMHELDQRKQRHGAVPDTAGTPMPGVAAQAITVVANEASTGGASFPGLRRMVSSGEIPSSNSATDLVKVGLADLSLRVTVPADPFNTAPFTSPDGKATPSDNTSRPTVHTIGSAEASFDVMFIQYFRRLLESQFPKGKLPPADQRLGIDN